MRRGVATLLLGALAGAAGADDGGHSAPPAVTIAQNPFTARLDALGEWCHASQLFAERNRVAEALLLFDPDHERAREWLGYSHQADGKWKRDKFSAAVDAAKDALPEWERRLAELTTPFKQLASVPRPRLADPKVAGLLDRSARALVILSPDDAGLRDAAGETKVAGRWILEESAATAAGRKRLDEAVRDAKKSTSKLEPVYARDPNWLVVFDYGGIRFHSAYPKKLSEELAVSALRARDLLERVFDTKLEPRPPAHVYVFADYWSHKRFLEQRPELTKEQRDRYDGFGDYWLDGNTLVSRSEDQPDRVDGIVRQIISNEKTALGRMYLASDWMGEGVGMYLTYLLVGTRLSVFANGDTRYSDTTIWRDVADPKSDWIALARRMIDGGFQPKIPALVGTPLNSMSKEDGLFAYALAAYFLESRPADAARLVKRSQELSNFHAALAEVCGLDAEGLEVRFVRWLRETK